MRYQVVEFVKTKEKCVQYVRSDAYAFREDKKHKLIQRLCFFVLGKIGAYDIGERIEHTRHIIDGSAFMDAILQQKHEVSEMFGEEPATLFIGGHDYAELMSCKELPGSFGFMAQYGLGGKLIDLDVKVIPWMRGALVVPKSRHL